MTAFFGNFLSALPARHPLFMSITPSDPVPIFENVSFTFSERYTHKNIQKTGGKLYRNDRGDPPRFLFENRNKFGISFKYPNGKSTSGGSVSPLFPTGTRPVPVSGQDCRPVRAFPKHPLNTRKTGGYHPGTIPFSRGFVPFISGFPF